MSKKPDRLKIKKKYLAGGISYAALAREYDLSVSTIKRWAKEEGWTQERNAIATELNQKLPGQIVKEQTELGKGINSAADKLLNLLVSSIDGVKKIDSKTLKELTGALRDLKEIKGAKSSIDLQQQIATIEKLRKETQKLSGEDKNKVVTVVMEGASGSYGG